MIIEFTPKGVCARKMIINVEDNRLVDLKVIGGCNGNLKGIASLVKGMKLDDIINKLDGIDCAGRGTSCPDQLAHALKMYKQR